MNFKLSKKIKELRTMLGFSQEELANHSNLSLRTIQRIENGETEPRGDTLKRLANTLEVKPSDLISYVEQEDRIFISFLNLSALSFLVYPVLGVIIPLSLWVLKRGKLKNVEEKGKRIINFQITWCLLIGLFQITMLAVSIFKQDFHFRNISLRNLMAYEINGIDTALVSIPIILYTYNFCFVIINTVRSYYSREIYYKPTVRFLK